MATRTLAAGLGPFLLDVSEDETEALDLTEHGLLILTHGEPPKMEYPLFPLPLIFSGRCVFYRD